VWSRGTARARDINLKSLMITTLFRPVGLPELSLIWDKEMREFPPRLPQQPFFYPVINLEYARQIAHDWNTRDQSSGFSGFVTSFEVATSYLSKFEPHTVGSSTHVEFWIPANELTAFNQAIVGTVHLVEGFFGTAFVGHIPHAFGLKGKNATAQFAALANSWEYSPMDVTCEVSANRKAVFLNWLFWSQHDFSEFGISEAQRAKLLENLKQCWELLHIEIPLPQKLNG
jgi:hypothetical protein